MVCLSQVKLNSYIINLEFYKNNKKNRMARKDNMKAQRYRNVNLSCIAGVYWLSV